MLWWILFVVSVIFIYVNFVKPHQYWKKRNIPYLKPWPILGNLGAMALYQKPFANMIIDIYAKFNTRYFGMYVFMQPTLMVKDLELQKMIFVKDFDHFVDHRDFISEEVDPIIGKNLFTLKGQKWRHMRSTLSPAFTGSKMRSMFILMSECADQFTNHFLKNCDPNKAKTVEMKEILCRFANDVIASTAFGIKCDSLAEENNDFFIMGKRATDFSGLRNIKFFAKSISPFLTDFFKVKFFDSEVSDFFRNIVVNNMKLREEKDIYRPDMIHLLMEARKGRLKHEDSVKNEDDNAGFATVEESDIGKDDRSQLQNLSDDDITAQAVLFFLAGFDGISTVMCHMANELALHADVQAKLQAEIDQTLKECDGKINYSAMMKMKYLDMVVCETLRKWPPSPVNDRICNKEYTIEPVDSSEEPFTIEKGLLIWVPVFAMHRDPNYFPDPERFDPERFSDENKDKIIPGSYTPFGIGPRNCIGSRFALLEVKTLFVHLLSKFDLVVDKKTQIPLKLVKGNFNILSEKGFWLGMKPRKLSA